MFILSSTIAIVKKHEKKFRGSTRQRREAVKIQNSLNLYRLWYRLTPYFDRYREWEAIVYFQFGTSFCPVRDIKQRLQFDPLAADSDGVLLMSTVSDIMSISVQMPIAAYWQHGNRQERG